MKKTLFLLVIVGTFLSCKCKTTALENEQKHTVKILEDCPTKAKCTQDIFKDSGLVLSKDDTGKPFYSIVAQLGSTVYQYQMSENKDEQYMDGGYREEIIFEVPTDLKDGIVSGKQILSTKALFGVFCYCKGKAGYYTINEGSITKTGKEITIEIPNLVEGQKSRVIKF